MKPYLKYCAAIVCFTIAGLLASRGLDGWGWFLFVGVLTMP